MENKPENKPEDKTQEEDNEKKNKITTHTSDPAKHPKGQADPNGSITQRDTRDDLEKNLHRASKDDKGPGDNK